MKPAPYRLLPVVALVLLAGCATTNRYGFTRAEWKAMPEADKAVVRSTHALSTNEERQQRAQENEEQRQLRQRVGSITPQNHYRPQSIR